jgi:hypothetical protein
MSKTRCDNFDKEYSWFYFEEVGIEYIDNSPIKIIVEVETKLSRNRVWEAFVNPETWKNWFPKVECVSYSGVMPYGVGTIRRSVVDGICYDETMLVWEEKNKWGYRINRATSAMSRAQLEITEFLPIESGTIVRWVLAFDPLHEINIAGFRKFLENLLKEAIANLEGLYEAGKI